MTSFLNFYIDYGTIIHRSQFPRLSNKAQAYLNHFIDYPRSLSSFFDFSEIVEKCRLPLICPFIEKIIRV
ncbi:Uncharacterised protein [Legionella pneumophila]|nr:Uncharacterised protein [Legionella pneumophila]